MAIRLLVRIAHTDRQRSAAPTESRCCWIADVSGGVAHRAPANNGIVVSTVPPTETGEPGDPNTAKPNGIAANMVFYAFLENDSQMPVAYLGEFMVAEAQPDAVTLKPTMPLDGPQHAAVGQCPAGPLELYEMMPIDAHECFLGRRHRGQDPGRYSQAGFRDDGRGDLEVRSSRWSPGSRWTARWSRIGRSLSEGRQSGHATRMRTSRPRTSG